MEAPLSSSTTFLNLPFEIRSLIINLTIGSPTTVQICGCERVPYYCTGPFIGRKQTKIPFLAPSISLTNWQLHAELQSPDFRKQVLNIFSFCSWECVTHLLHSATCRQKALVQKIIVTWPERRYFPGTASSDQELLYASAKERVLLRYYDQVETVKAESTDPQGSWVTVTVEMNVSKPKE